MVCSVCSIEDLCLEVSRPLDYNSQKQTPLDRILAEIIERRNYALKMLAPDYFRKFSTKDLPDQVLLVNGLALEASRLDDEYRKLSGNNFSDPNYEQLQYMLQGVKRVIQREMRYRSSRYSS
jgi:hypothetical protein